MMLNLFEYEDFAGILLDRLTTLMEATIEMNATSSNISWQEQVAANKQDIVMAGMLNDPLIFAPFILFIYLFYSVNSTLLFPVFYLRSFIPAY
jgi:hypothetical protein